MRGLFSVLREWRREQARVEGVEEYRVLPNATLEALVGALPRTKEELCAIKGIKEAKYRKYGVALLGIIQEQISGNNGMMDDPDGGESGIMNQESGKGTEEQYEEQPLSVSRFLDGLNIELSGLAARVQGEVSSVDERDRVVYFTIKDSEDESTLNCLIFRYQYEISGVRLAVGDEIIVEGVPEIYKPSGRMSLKVGVIELFGEGALKKAYDELKRKLEYEGLFAPERKRELPEFPGRIALITSEQGAAIGDFTMNLGQQGFRVDFYPVSVEGKRAVFEIIEALRYFDRQATAYDVLVLIRGGGSLESLQAFNNEALVREVAASRIPTLLGVGHEKDVTLAALVADRMVSTPTATARTLREPFDRARQTTRHAETLLLERFGKALSRTGFVVSRSEDILASVFPKLKRRFDQAEQELLRCFGQLRFSLKQAIDRCTEAKKGIRKGFESVRDRLRQSLARSEEKLREYDPDRALRLGYSLVKASGRLVRSVESVREGDTLDIRVQDGTIGTEVKRVTGDQ